MSKEDEIEMPRDFPDTPPQIKKRFRKIELRSIYNVYCHFNGSLTKTSNLLGFLTPSEVRREIENYTRGKNLIDLPLNQDMEIL